MRPNDKPKDPPSERVRGSLEVTFLPDKKKVTVEKGTTLMEAADLAGVRINSLCGGQGVCGKCKVKIKEGTVRGRQKSLSMLSKPVSSALNPTFPRLAYFQS